MRKRSARVMWVWAAGIAVIAVVIGLALGEFRTRGTATIGGFTVANYRARAQVQSTAAPVFELPSLEDGRPIALASFRGGILVLNFWASWCSPCRLEAPGLRWVSEHYRARGVRFLGVDERDNDPAGRAFVREFRLTYPSVTDPAGELADDYELVGMPTTFIIDTDGTIRYSFVGYLERDVLAAALDDLLSESAS